MLKFAKEFQTDDIEQDLVIPYSEWSKCGEPSEACMADHQYPQKYVDIHVRVYWKEKASNTVWTELCNGIGLSNDYTCKIDQSTGTITITTHNNIGVYRVVIIG